MLSKLAKSNGAILTYVVLAAWLIFKLWMWTSATGRIADGVLSAAEHAGKVSVVDVLPFPAATFHVDKLQEFGGIRRVNGNQVTLRSVTAESVTQMAQKYFWIDQIRLAPPPGQ